MEFLFEVINTYQMNSNYAVVCIRNCISSLNNKMKRVSDFGSIENIFISELRIRYWS